MSLPLLADAGRRSREPALDRTHGNARARRRGSGAPANVASAFRSRDNDSSRVPPKDKPRCGALCDKEQRAGGETGSDLLRASHAAAAGAQLAEPTMPEDGSPVKMPNKTKLATGQVVSQLKGARQARLEDEVRELRAKCEKLEKDYKDMKKKYNQIRMAQAPTTRVVKASTVATKVDRPKSAAKSKPTLPEIKGAEEAPAEDTSLLHQEIEDLKRRLADSEDARRIEKENVKYEISAKQEKISALEAEVRSLMMMVQREQSAVSPRHTVVDNSAELEAMRRRVREAEQAAAACAHVARAADMQRAEHDSSYAKLRGQLREVKLKLCKYELECTW